MAGPSRPGAAPREAFKLGAFGISLLLHGVVLAAVSGVVLSRPHPPVAHFTALEEMPLPLLVEHEGPEDQPDETLPEPDRPQTDDGAPEMATASQIASVDPHAIDIISSPVSTPGHWVATPSGLPSGTAALGFGAGGQGTGIGSGSGSGRKNTNTAAVSVKKVFGMEVAAQKMAVILDCSASMTSVLPQVVDEIRLQFPGAPVIGAYGCTVGSGQSYVHEKSAVPIRDARHNMVRPVARLLGNDEVYWTNGGADSALHYAIKFLGVDAVYWFADFQDPIDSRGMEALATALLLTGVKLYVHSVEVDPGTDITSAVRLSGGQVLIRNLK